MMPPQPGPPGQPQGQPAGGLPPNPQLQQAQAQLQEIQKKLEQIQENKQVLALLRDEKTRGYRIEIETDSTIEPDEQAEKKSRIEFTEVFSKYLAEAVPNLQIMPQAAPLYTQGLMFLVRGFRAGRELEDTIETTMAAIGQAAQQPKPDPEQQKIEAQLKQSEAQHQQTMAQSDQQHQQTLQQKDTEFQHKMALEQEKAATAREQHAMTMQAAERQGERDQQKHGMEIQAKQEDRQTAQQAAQLQFEGMDREQTRAEQDHGMKTEQANQAHAQKTEQTQQSHEATLKEKDSVAVQSGSGDIKKALGELGKKVEEIAKKADAAAKEMDAPADVIHGRDGRISAIKRGNRTIQIRRQGMQ